MVIGTSPKDLIPDSSECLKAVTFSFDNLLPSRSIGVVMSEANENAVVTRSFDGDMLERRAFGESIYKLIHSLPRGVIALDGDWGVGKSWFGENLKKLIQEKNELHAVLVNAFEADWADDPSLALIASIASQLPEEKQEKFITSVAPMVLRAVPALSKVAVKAVANYVGVDKDIAGALADAIKGGADSYVKGKLKQLTEKSKDLNELKSAIYDCIRQEGVKKIVIFVDELDRCSPEYSIKFLERLKHLFEINGVVFVLLWNRRQIKNAVESFYGPGTNGQMYLDKFIDYPLSLPISNTRASDAPLARYLQSLLMSIDERKRPQLEDNLDWLTAISTILGLNAREVSRVADWWIMSNVRSYKALVSWLLGLKVKFPNLYLDIMRGSKQAHMEVIEIIKQAKYPSNNEKVASLFLKYHNAHASSVFDENDKELRQFFGQNFTVSVEESLAVSLRHIEATID